MRASLGATARGQQEKEDLAERGGSSNVETGGALVSSPTDTETSMPSSAGALDSNNSSSSSSSSRTGVRWCWRRWTFNETWFFHDLPVETVSYSRFSDDSNNKAFLMYVNGLPWCRYRVREEAACPLPP